MNEDCIKAQAAIAAPAAPTIAAAQKPKARPRRVISADKGLADSMDPSTIIEIGSVAQQGFGDRTCPARPPTVKIIGICDPMTA